MNEQEILTTITSIYGIKLQVEKASLISRKIHDAFDKENVEILPAGLEELLAGALVGIRIIENFYGISEKVTEEKRKILENYRNVIGDYRYR